MWVIESSESGEWVMSTLKAYATRALNAIVRRRRTWARRGSVRMLGTPEAVAAAVRYVVDQQGSPMAVWERLRAGEGGQL